MPRHAGAGGERFRSSQVHWEELIALAKSKPGTLNYGSYGIGTYAHLSMEDFKQRTGTDIVHIPFRGAAPAANCAAREAT